MAKQYRYFLYSRTQHQERTKIEATIGYRYIPGKIIKNGRWREFTEISASPNSTKYPDSTIIAEGYMDDLRYEPSTRKRKEK